MKWCPCRHRHVHTASISVGSTIFPFCLLAPASCPFPRFPPSPPFGLRDSSWGMGGVCSVFQAPLRASTVSQQCAFRPHSAPQPTRGRCPIGVLHSALERRRNLHTEQAVRPIGRFTWPVLRTRLLGHGWTHLKAAWRFGLKGWSGSLHALRTSFAAQAHVVQAARIKFRGSAWFVRHTMGQFPGRSPLL